MNWLGQGISLVQWEGTGSHRNHSYMSLLCPSASLPGSNFLVWGLFA